jgi:hypothetical protein
MVVNCLYNISQDLCGRQVVLGASGGSRITSAVIQGTVINTVISFMSYMNYCILHDIVQATVILIDGLETRWEYNITH